MKHFITHILSITMIWPAAKQSDITLTVQIDGLKNKNGYIAVALYDQYGDFPEGEGVQTKYVEVDGSSMEVVFQNIAPGDYAVALLHDENGNEEMDYNEYQMPLEGFAFSNNAVAQSGPPSFGEASFTVSEDKVITLDMVYLIR